MRKFLRNLFSGYFFVLLMLLAELLAIAFGQNIIDNIISNIVSSEQYSEMSRLLTVLIYLFVRFIVFIIAIIIFFKIVNKDEDPEFKIPWIVLMILLPFFCSIMFLVFGNHGLRKKDSIIITESQEAYFQNVDLTKREVFKETLGNAYGAFNYIFNTTKLMAHKGNRITYFKSGEEFFPQMIEDLKLAKEFIFMEFFIIADGELWNQVTDILIQKAKEGVEIKIVYDDMGCGGTISHRTPRILGKYGIKCYKFHPFRPLLSGMYNNRDHRKIVVIDHQFGYTGGMNLGDEYANIEKRFGYWKDTMIKIEGSAINNLISIFLQNYSMASGKVDDYDKYLQHHYHRFEDSGYIAPFGDGPGGIDDALVGEQNYINIINFAQEEVYISTPYLIPTYGLIDAMRNAALRGVKVHLIVPGIPDKRLIYTIGSSNFRYLLDAGVHIYRYSPGFNHMKSCLADSKMAFIGTINFDFRSLVHHFECGALMYDVSCIKDIEADFKQMLYESEEVPEDFHLKGMKKRLCAVAKLITPLL